MKILLDENISMTLLIDFSKHIVRAADEMGWSGKKNGELLRLLRKNRFAVLITMDGNIKYQQGIKEFPITIFVLCSVNNMDETVQPLIESVRKKLNGKLNKGVIEIK